MNHTLARLHGFDFAAAGLSDFGKPQGYVARQIRRWSEQYRASETERIADMDRLIAWLPDAAPPDSGAAVVHGDFRLDNCIIHPAEPRVFAVLDWELSTIGDPVADFTYHLMHWFMPVSETGAGVGSLVGHDGRSRNSRLRELHRGLLPPHGTDRACQTWVPTWPITSSGSPRSCRAFWAGSRRYGGQCRGRHHGAAGAAAGRDSLAFRKEGWRMSGLRIGLALGGGSARGLAHIPMLEVFDELGLKPSVIAGCSIGSLIGSAYAGGMSARDIRDHAEMLLTTASTRCAMSSAPSASTAFDLLALKGLASLHVQGEKLVELALPEGVPALIEDTGQSPSR